MQKNISCSKVGMLWLLMVWTGVASAGAAEFAWPGEWLAFGPVPPAGDMLVPGGTPALKDLLPGDNFKRMPGNLRVNDTDYAGQAMKLADGALVEFDGIYPSTQRGDTLYLIASVVVEQAGEYNIHAGANWWMQWWINGEPVFSTIPQGNRESPISINNHVFPVELRAGENVLAVAVISGSGGFNLAAGTSREVKIAAAAAAAVQDSFRGAYDRVWQDIKSGKGTPLLVGGGIDFAAARARFAEILTLAGDDRERAMALLDMADCKINDLQWTDMDSVRADYTAVLESSAPAEYRARAAIGIGETWLREGEYETAREYIEWARAEYKISRTPALVAAAQFARARSFMQERDYTTALNEFSHLMDTNGVPEKIRLEAQAHSVGILLVSGLRPDRPRMFFTADNWPAVKARALGTQSEAFDKMRADIVSLAPVDIRPADWSMRAMEAALVYRVTHDERVFDLACGMLRATLDGWMQGEGDNRYYSRAAYAAALDWVWNDLPPTERLELARDFIRYAFTIYTNEKIYGNLDKVGFYYLRNMFWYAGLAGLDPELDDVDYARAVAVLGQGHIHNWELWSRAVERALNDGGSGAFAVGRLGYEYAETPNPVWTYMHCMQSAFGENVPAAWVYLGITPHHVMRNMLGITPRPGIKHFGFSRDWRPRGGAMNAGLLYDHLAQFIHFFGASHPREAGIARHLRERIATEGRPGAGQFPVYPFLLNLEDAPPAGIPPGMPLARNFENRGKVLMSSGFGSDDTYILFSCGGGEFIGGHRDAGHFTIYRQGFLALDTGTRAHSYIKGPDGVTFYFAQTIAHNSVLLRNPDRTVKWDGEELAHTGGQDRDRQFAEVLAFETSPHYAYVATDLTPTYNTDECAQMVRQFVFLPPHHAVVFDRVTAIKPEYEKIWLFHTANEPALAGQEFSADQDQGRVFCRTLYPTDAVLTKIGGSGKEFWASGRNWGLPENSRFMRNLGMESADDVPEVQGRWRVEVTPGEERKEDYFLHLIKTADQLAEQMVGSEVREENDSLEIRFTADNLDYTLVFNKTGVVGGVIIIRKDGELVLHQPFTDEIMPQSGLALEGDPVWGSEYAVALNLEDMRQPDMVDILEDDPRSAAVINLAGVAASCGGHSCLKGDEHCAEISAGGISSTECLAVAGLIDALSNPRVDVQRRAAWALGRIGCPAVVNALSETLNDSDGMLNSAVVTALSRIAALSGSVDAVESLTVALDNASAVLRRQITDALGRATLPAAVIPLTGILSEDDEPEVRAAAAAALGMLGVPESVDALAAALEDADWRVRRQAVVALTAVGRPAVPVLLNAMTASDETMQNLAVEALITIGAPAFELLLPVLNSENPRLRGNAAAALTPPTGDQRALSPVLQLATDNDAFVRANAMRALGRIGGMQSVEALKLGFRDEHAEVRAAAAAAFRDINDELPLPELLAALADEAGEVRVVAVETLARRGDAMVVEPLIGMLDDGDETVRMAAAMALGELGDSRAVPALIDAMNDDYHGVGYAANDALCIITGHKVVIPIGWPGATIRQHRRPLWVKWLESQ